MFLFIISNIIIVFRLLNKFNISENNGEKWDVYILQKHKHNMFEFNNLLPLNGMARRLHVYFKKFNYDKW